MATLFTDAFATMSSGITFLMGEPLLLIPVGLSIAGLVVRQVKKMTKGR